VHLAAASPAPGLSLCRSADGAGAAPASRRAGDVRVACLPPRALPLPSAEFTCRAPPGLFLYLSMRWVSVENYRLKCWGLTPPSDGVSPSVSSSPARYLPPLGACGPLQLAPNGSSWPPAGALSPGALLRSPAPSCPWLPLPAAPSGPGCSLLGRRAAAGVPPAGRTVRWLMNPSRVHGALKHSYCGAQSEVCLQFRFAPVVSCRRAPWEHRSALAPRGYAVSCRDVITLLSARWHGHGSAAGTVVQGDSSARFPQTDSDNV